MDPNLKTPDDASDLARMAAEAIRSILPGNASTGGCRAFYTPEEWAARGEDYGTDSVLVVVHDGGCLAGYCNQAYTDYHSRERLRRALADLHLYPEQCTSWYTAIYPLPAVVPHGVEA